MIRKQLDDLFELLGLCHLAVNGSIIQIHPENYYKSLSLDDTIKERDQVAEQIGRQIPDGLRPYFQTFAKIPSNLAYLLLLSFYDFRADSLTQAKKTVMETFHQYSLSEFPSFTISDFGLNMESADKRCPFTDSLSAIDLTDEERFSILSAFLNFDALVPKLFDFLEQIRPLLPDVDLTDFTAYWESPDTIKELDAFFMKKRGDYLNLETSEVEVIPSCYDPTRLTLSIFDSDSNNKIRIIVGFRMSLLQLIQAMTKTRAAQIEKTLKLLSDPSKYAILQMIKHKPCYGAEIAKAMNLKTSTVSYHLSAFTDVSLVHIKKVENRVYFQLNHETMDAFIQSLKEEFE